MKTDKATRYGNTVRKSRSYETTLDFLPGGHNQSDQLLPEPIIVTKKRYYDEFVPNTGFGPDMIPNKSRQCRTCGKDLPETRHWHCTSCKSLPNDLGPFAYCEVSGE